jgi:hypothetical protein
MDAINSFRKFVNTTLKYLCFMATCELLILLNCWCIMCLIKGTSLMVQCLTSLLVSWIAGVVCFIF